ncbi:MAG: GNAT family N-acetyltransferase [Actinomycetota bacterium]|nr:GNAT family N-acetyltransferase [Actinomycetota bacterium]
MLSSTTVRVGGTDDAAAIGLVHVRSWQAAYVGHFPQAYLDGLDPEARAAGWRRYLEAGDHDREALLVVECDGELVGFASLGPCRDPDAAGVGELYALYLLPEAWGRGAGRELMAAAVGVLAVLGFDQATLWVLDANARARLFYEAAGWAADGATRVEDRFGFPVPEVRYRRALP